MTVVGISGAMPYDGISLHFFYVYEVFTRPSYKVLSLALDKSLQLFNKSSTLEAGRGRWLHDNALARGSEGRGLDTQ